MRLQRSFFIVGFDLVTRKGTFSVRCTCSIRKQRTATAGLEDGLDLTIIDMDDSKHKMLLAAYVRWLSYKAVSGE